jgi:hypothetical protein
LGTRARDVGARHALPLPPVGCQAVPPNSTSTRVSKPPLSTRRGGRGVRPNGQRGHRCARSRPSRGPLRAVRDRASGGLKATQAPDSSAKRELFAKSVRAPIGPRHPLISLIASGRSGDRPLRNLSRQVPWRGGRSDGAAARAPTFPSSRKSESSRLPVPKVPPKAGERGPGGEVRRRGRPRPNISISSELRTLPLSTRRGGREVRPIYSPPPTLLIDSLIRPEMFL